jgi:hypothetical protein
MADGFAAQKNVPKKFCSIPAPMVGWRKALAEQARLATADDRILVWQHRWCAATPEPEVGDRAYPGA